MSGAAGFLKSKSDPCRVSGKGIVNRTGRKQIQAMRLLLIALISLNSAAGPAFAHGAGAAAEVVEKTTRSWNDNLLPAYPEGQPEITLLKITIPPHSRIPWHKHPVINCGYLLQGELRVTADDGKVLHMKEGDPIPELVEQWHYGENPGDEPAVILVFYAGIGGSPITVLKTAEADLDDSERALFDHGWKPEVFKKAGDVYLNLWYKKPADHDGSAQTPAIVFFYGGGWRGRKMTHFQEQGDHLVERGMVVILADYRAASHYGGSPFDCVEDAKSAIRHVRATAAAHGIDPDRIAAGGGSAGGHLAAATALVTGFNAPDDPAVSCRPDALVLFNPVYDNSENGYGMDRLKSRWKEISPFHHIGEGAPPNIVFLGDQDQYLPVSTAKLWKQKMESAGTRSDLQIYENRGHGFFNRGTDYADTLAKADAFLVSLGYLPKR